MPDTILAETKHTPTPWKSSPHSARGDVDLCDERGGWFMSLLTGAAEDRAPALEQEIQAQFEVDCRFIVTACNAHDDLVAALTGALVANHLTLASQDEPEWAKRARAAILKARGETEPSRCPHRCPRFCPDLPPFRSPILHP